jgi:hypothetical protein
MLCWRTSILTDTSPARACSTWLAPAQFHDLLLADPHTRPAETRPLLEEPTRIGIDPSERGGECPKHGASACSHGTFLHVARQTLKPPAPLHYISRDHPNAHELTNHIRHRHAGRRCRRKALAASGRAQVALSIFLKPDDRCMPRITVARTILQPPNP